MLIFRKMLLELLVVVKVHVHKLMVSGNVVVTMAGKATNVMKVSHDNSCYHFFSLLAFAILTIKQ